MESVRVISKTTIFAKTDLSNIQQNPRIELTPWDLQYLLLDPIQKGLLFHRPKSLKPFINHLKTSLSHTLHYFPPLAGRLATTKHEEDNSISFSIDCNNSGTEFLHAIADGVSVTDIIDATYIPDKIVSFFPHNGTKNYEGSSKPLIAVQVTELVDGIFVACAMNHSIVDGTSFWHFINCWSEISRGSDSISKSPIIERDFLSFMNFPIRIPSVMCSRTQILHDKSSLNHKQLSSTGSTPPNLKERIFHFSRENISKLKAKANAEIGETNKITSLQAMLSHIWRSIVRNRKTDSNEVQYRLPIGVRSKLKNPPLPQEYFGNAIRGGGVVMKAGEVEERGLGQVALEMNRWVEMNTEEELIRFLEDWIRNPKLMVLENVVKDAVFTSSSPRFDVYGNDFGWGKPIAVRSGAANKFDGNLIVLEGVEEGSVDVEVCLKLETLQGMEMDSEFMDGFI